MAKQIPIEFDDDSSFKPEQPAVDNTFVKPVETRQVEEDLKKQQAGARKNPKEKAGTEPQIPEDQELFQKSYYAIGEVAKMFGEQTSLIRYWTNEFKVLKPKTNRKGDRYFRPEDVKILQLIYHLLRDRKFTMEGAKEFLKNERMAGEKFELLTSLEELKQFLQQLKNNL